LAQIPLSLALAALVILLALSGFFSMSETAMMAANRYKLRHLARQGQRGAALALALLAHTDRLLGVILIGNNLINTGAATLVSLITIEMFGNEKWILGLATLLITFAILVFAEITPKIIGAAYADRISPWLGYIFTPLIRIFQPITWFINLFAQLLLRLMGLSQRPAGEAPKLTPEELRTLVMESRELIPPTHGSILMNLFDLGGICVEDVMTPRGAIEILDLDAPWEDVLARIGTSQHTRLPVCRESLDHLQGVLPVRRVMLRLHDPSFSADDLKAHIQPPYYIPAGTPLFAQLRFFQENRQRLGFVVDEYGEVMGLLTLEDIISEIVGEFAGTEAGAPRALSWEADGTILVEGQMPLRELNRKLGLDFPVDGPKTLNGLILEHFEDIPEASVSLKLHGVTVEIVQTQDRSVKTAKIYRPESKPPKPETAPESP
jgi:Mg2+/Co2+ transporter CorB